MTSKHTTDRIAYEAWLGDIADVTVARDQRIASAREAMIAVALNEDATPEALHDAAFAMRAETANARSDYEALHAELQARRPEVA